MALQIVNEQVEKYMRGLLTRYDEPVLVEMEALAAEKGFPIINRHVGDAVTAFNGVEGDWDIVYCDIDKHGYPEAWEAARDRVKIGGMYICDNVLWSGRVAEDKPKDDVREGWTEAIKKHNAMIAADER